MNYKLQTLNGGNLPEKMSYDEIMEILNKDKLFNIEHFMSHNSEINNKLKINKEAIDVRFFDYMSYIRMPTNHSERDASNPGEITVINTELYSSIKSYMRQLFQKSEIKQEIINSIFPRCLKYAGLIGLTHNDVKIDEQNNNFYKSILIGIISRILFKDIHDDFNDIQKNGITFEESDNITAIQKQHEYDRQTIRPLQPVYKKYDDEFYSNRIQIVLYHM